MNFLDGGVNVIELPKKEEGKIPVSGEIEYETHLSKNELIEFLKGMLDQLESKNTVDLKLDGYEIRFVYREPVEVEIDYAHSKKLKIKIEFRQRSEIQFI